MDVQPTTSHEIVQNESQPSIDALRRVATARDALLLMHETLPTLAEADARGARALLDALPGFWSSSGPAGGETRRVALARHLASVMKEEATLRGLDGTLREDAVSLATRVTTANGTAPVVGVHARELMLGDVPHAGSLIVTEEGQPGLALLFTAHGGWEAFDSLDRLLEATRRRLLESVDVGEGSGLGNDEFAEAKAKGSVGSREMIADVFSTLASRMIDVQQQRIALAADDYALDSDEPDAATQLADRIRYELSPAAMLDIDAIEDLREARLLEATVASRLANVPNHVRVGWYEARDTYNDVLAGAAMVRMATGTQPPLSLHAFASRELAVKLAALGIDESPEGITVDVARAKVLPEALEILDPLPGSTKVRRISLIDLACQNIGRFSLDTLRASDMQGMPLGARLDGAAIRAMVRDLDIANRYQTHIEQRLRQGRTGALSRKLAVALQAARLRMEAAEARLSYFVPNEPRSFIDDRDERGFGWVTAALDAPTGQRRVDGHTVAVAQLFYKQVPLDGILVFASNTPSSAPRVVMYTPDAPDGLTFREFESRQEAAKRFLYHPAFREYLLDRLPAEFAKVSPNGATRHFAGDRLAHWVLGANRDAAYTQTEEPFDERLVTGDFIAASYDATVEKYRKDAKFLARSTADADSDALFGLLQGRFDPTTRLVEAAVIDAPLSLARMMQASWRFYDHVKAGDTGEAFVAFTAGYVSALGLVTPPYIGGRHIAGAIVRSRATTQGVTHTGVRLAPPRVHFEDRYAVRGLRKPGKPDGEGIFRVRGETYIEHEGMHYLVRHDGDYGRWRLRPTRGASDMRFTGPLIERIDGQWVFVQDAGLLGGMRRLRQRLRNLTVRNDVPGQAAPVAGGAAAPAPVAPTPGPRPLDLPPILEPHRAEITAVLSDNPSANVLVRNDGSHLKFGLPSRSAMIVDPDLHPDIAELSAHQRRVFLHELDTRFPLAAERAEVLRIRGWARDDGRRIPSPPPSPGVEHAADIQSPSISSSTGDPVWPLAQVTPDQQRRWDDALAVARSTPRVPTHRSGAPNGNVVAESLPATEVVPRNQWPDRIWYFSEREFEVEFWPGISREGVTLGHSSTWIDPANGLRTYPVTVLPPETPVNRLSEALGTSPVHQAGQRDPLGYSIQIDLSRLRDPWTPVGPHHVVVGPGADLELRRRILPSGEFQYSLQSPLPIRIHSLDIVGVGRQGERPTPFGRGRQLRSR